KGVSRRFQSVGTCNGIEVIDDFAHNPDKIGAALAAAHSHLDRSTGGRLLAVFQPHGYGPTRFLRDALIETFSLKLRAVDQVWLPEIYYAGGSVTRDISSRDIVEAVSASGATAHFQARREDIVGELADVAQPGDLILVMGARDPSLTDFCMQIVDTLARRHGAGDTAP
ncbi:MAG: cyanophycin synthetase, partial [bacterium]